MAFTNYQIKPFDSSNYSTWSTDVWFLLHEKNCFEIVAGKESAPEIKEENRQELKDFNARQQLALSILYLNISTEYRSIIENVTDPAEAWKLLRDNFQPDNRRECHNGSTTASSSATYQRSENIEQVQNCVDIHMYLHLLGLLCQVMSSIVILFEVVDETETVHLRTKAGTMVQQIL
ncbi:retrovirus-related Pol polyprotein from transposon TNT 1-94 [Trichonephila clavipes]|nr:retrovirus-related Pol polyprotein from transposon TNT 1-94 [Trichonephila clavipes]